jgi:hypothetical protein
MKGALPGKVAQAIGRHGINVAPAAQPAAAAGEQMIARKAGTSWRNEIEMKKNEPASLH